MTPDQKGRCTRQAAQERCCAPAALPRILRDPGSRAPNHAHLIGRGQCNLVQHELLHVSSTLAFL